MKRRSTHSLFGSFSGLALAALACAGSITPTKIATLNPAPANAGAVVTSTPSSTGNTPMAAVDPPTTLNTTGYKDDGGNYHVVGILHNGTSQAVGKIELTLTLTDENGRNLLTDDYGKPISSLVFEPMLATLGPGEDSPFDSFRYGPTSHFKPPDEAAQHIYKLTVTSYQAVEETRGKVTVQDLKIEHNPAANYLDVKCQLVNQDSQATLLAGEAAALLDSHGGMVSVYGGPYKHLLAPAGDPAGNDHIPYEFILDYRAGSVSDLHRGPEEPCQEQHSHRLERRRMP